VDCKRGCWRKGGWSYFGGSHVLGPCLLVLLFRRHGVLRGGFFGRRTDLSHARGGSEGIEEEERFFIDREKNGGKDTGPLVRLKGPEYPAFS